MKNIRYKVFLMLFLLMVLMNINTVKVKAATFSLTSSTSTVEPGGNFNITINTNGAGYVNLTCTNGVLSENYVWVEGSKTITCKAANSGNGVTISASGIIGDFDTEKDEKKSGSISVQIKEKTKVEENTNKNTNTNTKTNKNTTTQKKVDNNAKKNTQQSKTKKEEDIVVNKEDQGTKEELLIEDMNVFMIDKEGNKESIKLTPEFDGKVTDYTLNVENRIDKIEFDSKYNKEYELKIEGLEENLKVGENIVKLTLTRNEESKVYTIKVIKEEEKIVDENEKNAERIETKEKNSQKELSFSILEFIGIIIGCILIENLMVLSVYKIIKAKKQENY